MRFLYIFLVLLISILITDINYTEYKTRKDARSRFVSLKSILTEDDKLSFSLIKNSKGYTGCVADKGKVTITDKGQRKSIKPYSRSLNTIHVFGDSFTFGFGVDDNETFPAYLEEYNSSYNVLNYGVPGFGLTQMYLSLLMNIENLHKGDIVLFSPIIEDFFRDLYTPRKVLWMKTFSNLKFEKFPVYADGEVHYKNLAGLKYYLSSKIYLSFILGKFTREFFGNKMGSIATSKQILNDLKERLSRRGVKFILAFLPTLNDEQTANQLVMGSIAGHREVFNKYKAIKNKKTMFRLACDFHYNKRGNMFIAKELSKIIGTTKL